MVVVFFGLRLFSIYNLKDVRNHLCGGPFDKTDFLTCHFHSSKYPETYQKHMYGRKMSESVLKPYVKDRDYS